MRYRPFLIANPSLFGSKALCIMGCQAQRTNIVTTRSIITSLFQDVAREQKRPLAPLSDDLKLLESGLDSLSFALIVARLEDALGFDPFDTQEALSFPVTFGDFVRLYESRSS
jgi:hypothetical protein